LGEKKTYRSKKRGVGGGGKRAKPAGMIRRGGLQSRGFPERKRASRFGKKPEQGGMKSKEVPRRGTVRGI